MSEEQSDITPEATPERKSLRAKLLVSLDGLIIALLVLGLAYYFIVVQNQESTAGGSQTKTGKPAPSKISPFTSKESGLLGIYMKDLIWGDTALRTYHPTAIGKEDILTTQIDPDLDFDWLRVGAPFPGRFSVEWFGKLLINKEGRYHFALESDDGSALYINDSLIVNNWGGHSRKRSHGEVALQAGEHAIVVRYYNVAGSAVMRLLWEYLGTSKTAVSRATKLKPVPPHVLKPLKLDTE